MVRECRGPVLSWLEVQQHTASGGPAALLLLSLLGGMRLPHAVVKIHGLTRCLCRGAQVRT